VVLLGVLALEPQLRLRCPHERRPQICPRRRVALAPLEPLLHEVDNPFVLDVPRCGDDDVRRHIHLVVVARDRVVRDRRDHLGRPDHRPPEWMVAEDGVGDQIVDELLWRVLVHGDLLEHDLALRLELGERRREDHVAHHVDRRRQMVVGNACVDERVLA